MIELNGITWNHTRGYLPMVATAQRFSELNSGVHIHWQKRSLQAFADAPLADLAARFDLMVIDHPSIGEAAELGLLLPLDEYLPADFLQDQVRNSVGESHASYYYAGHQYALAIDAATPVAGYRADLLERAKVEPPRTWSELLALAHRGLVAVPAIAIDSLMNFFMLANALGDEPFAGMDEVVGEAAGKQALKMLRELVQLSASGSLERNPIATWQLLCEGDKVAYCPFAYGYSNYSRRGYAGGVLTTGGLVRLEPKSQPLRSTLGGAGLAVSKSAKHSEVALAYAQFVAGAETQATIYANAGGQPGHRTAWQDSAVNVATNSFFSNTLETLDAAWGRPRFAGFIGFQDEASRTVHEYLVRGGNETKVLEEMNNALRRAKKDRA